MGIFLWEGSHPSNLFDHRRLITATTATSTLGLQKDSYHFYLSVLCFSPTHHRQRQYNRDSGILKMSQQNKGVLPNESKNGEEKDNNHDQDVEETIVSDDDVIDYLVKPEFYDPNLDDKDQLWIQKKRKGQYSDAVLTCPACFTTLCLECQRHEKYVTQYRAIFVLNCKIKKGQVSNKGSLKRKRVRKGGGLIDGESFSPVCCSVCETEVGVIDDDEVYHFYNVLPSEC
ncbi:hypothetical protein L1887_34864 [Cichorium endivia]|nr:hypothetical protein L1887_34864 [Cichorium endivia]